MDGQEGKDAQMNLSVEMDMRDFSGEEDAGACESCGAHLRLGRSGERAARRLLEMQGFEILETNWTCVAGEVDIIARHADSLHFVEVKTRRGVGKGFPVEAVSAEKRRRYERMAELYLRRAEPQDCSLHFDIISVLVLDERRGFLKLYPDAYSFDR